MASAGVVAFYDSLDILVGPGLGPKCLTPD